MSARMGMDVVMRQVLFGAGNYHLVDRNFEPLPVSGCLFPLSVMNFRGGGGGVAGVSPLG